MILKTLNLACIVRGKKRVISSLLFGSGFNSKTGIYYPKGNIHIQIQSNNLNGGYIGNTLLIPVEKNADFSLSKKDIRVGDYIFTNAQLIIEVDGERYCLNGKYGYLRLKASFLSELN